MKNSNYLLNEEVVLTGVLARPSSIEEYVKLFFMMFNHVSKAYKKESKPENYEHGCGKLYDPENKVKIVSDRITYTLLDEIVLTKRKIFYTLSLDIDSQNALIQYRDYKNKSLRDKYLAIMLVKKHLVSLLKQAGFVVKTDKCHLYASCNNYIKEPSEIEVNGEPTKVGRIIMNSYQEALFKRIKPMFNFEAVLPGNNKYAIKLVNASAVHEIKDGNAINVLPEKIEFPKILISTNGLIKVFPEKKSKEPSIVLYDAFEHIVPEEK